MNKSGSRKPIPPASEQEAAALPNFSDLAKAYIARATVSQKIAIDTLKRIGTYGAKGKLTNHYR